MKAWLLLIGLTVILALLCSPALAISESELLSRYKAQFAPFLDKPNSFDTFSSSGGWSISPTPPSQLPSDFIPSPSVKPYPSPIKPTEPLSISSSPSGALVYVDGTLKGITPIGTYVSVGSHQIKLSKIGYNDHTVSVNVKAGDRNSISATLVPLSGPTEIVPTVIPQQTPMIVPTPIPAPESIFGYGFGSSTLRVTSDPPGAQVYLDGAYKGTTPIEIARVSNGFHWLRVTLGGIDHSTLVLRETLGWSVPTYGVLDSLGSLNIHVTQQETEVSVEDPTAISKKPNIYLYSDRDLTAQVRLSPEQAITVSEPAYQPGKGWLAEVWNGSLNGAGDFLFYEALVPDSGWQKKEGYIIRVAHLEQDMTSMLGQYGFNEKETAEFIDYWASHLAGDVDYVLYPQETGAVDRIMPLSISPEPDEVSRIWFYAEPLVSAPGPVTHQEKIIREGFYVVEWGVIIKE